MSSQIAKSVRETLSEAFPNVLIKDEEYVSYKGQRLFFDFYLPTLELYVEVQGIQHTQFSPHFHQDAAAFRAQKKRDRLKVDWCADEEKTLITINYDEIPISVENLLIRIEAAQDGRES